MVQGKGQGLGREEENQNLSAIDREVQRRLVRRMVSAGVRQGDISLEVLFMLPSEFVRAYTKLFDSALKENVSGSNMGGSGDTDPVRTAVNRPLRDQDQAKGKREVKKIGIYGSGGGGGKRFREYWYIRSEKAFKHKQSVDRKLRRLASEISRDLGSRSTGHYEAISCPTCKLGLDDLIAGLRDKLHYCPGCGSVLRRNKGN